MLLMLQGGEMLQFSQLYLYGPTVVILAMVLAFMLRALPTWRVMKTRELDIREIEAQARSSQADALKSLGDSLGGLGSALNRNSEVLSNVAIEQRRATDAIRLLQRINGDSTDHLRATVEDLVSRLAEIETERNEPENPRSNSH
jgi:hypothetical protein